MAATAKRQSPSPLYHTEQIHLARFGQIAQSTDGAELVNAFEMVKPDEYDAILMDIQTPHMNGYEAMKAKVSDELKQHFRPEFLNRVDEIVVFHQLSQADIERIVDLMVAEIETRLRDKDMGIELTPAAKTLIAKRGFDPVLGARPLRRAIQRDRRAAKAPSTIC